MLNRHINFVDLSIERGQQIEHKCFKDNRLKIKFYERENKKR